MNAREIERARVPTGHSVTVLMYHALFDDRDEAGADPHYAVSTSAFAAHVDMFVRVGRRLASVQQLLDGERDGALALTFDDGHASDVRAAQNMSAPGGMG